MWVCTGVFWQPHTTHVWPPILPVFIGKLVDIPDSTKYLFFIFFVVFGHKRQKNHILRNEALYKKMFLFKEAFKIHFVQKNEVGACAKCDHHKMKVRKHERAQWHLEVRGACVRHKKWSQQTLWLSDYHNFSMTQYNLKLGRCKSLSKVS